MEESITPIFAQVTDNGSGAPVSSEPSAVAQQNIGGDDAYSALAVINVNGSSQVDAFNTNLFGIAYSGDPSTRTIRSSADFVARYSNVGSTPVYGTFSYTISGVKLQVNNAGGSVPRARVEHEFTTLFGPGPSFDAELELIGNYNDFSYGTSTGFQAPTITREECLPPNGETCYTGIAEVAPLTKEFALGILQPGESVYLTYRLAVEIEFSGTEVGAKAFARDPGGPVFAATPVTETPAVPLPASGVLLLGALGAAATLRRRRG